jgi:hypothetical protein
MCWAMHHARADESFPSELRAELGRALEALGEPLVD